VSDCGQRTSRGASADRFSEDDRDELGHAETNGCAQLEEPFAFDLREKDSLLGNVLPKHLVLGLEELDLSPEFGVELANKNKNG
jgi:hypothetical protein